MHADPKFPNGVVLNAVGRRNTQVSAKERKRKSAKERKELETARFWNFQETRRGPAIHG